MALVRLSLPEEVCGRLWGGVATAAPAATAFGLLHAGLPVGLALSQHVYGLGIILLATALSYFG